MTNEMQQYSTVRQWHLMIGVWGEEVITMQQTISKLKFTAILISENISAHKQRAIYYCNNAMCLEAAIEYLSIHGQLFLLASFISGKYQI